MDLHARFRRDVLQNPFNRQILERWSALDLPDGWLVAGCLFQTVWNLQSGQAPTQGIQDYDLFYFDAADLGAEAERATQHRVETVLADLGITVDVVNQARVHCWYEAHFGFPFAALHSAREGIDHFLIPGTCVGITPDAVYAPYGLQLLYDGVLEMNPLTPHEPLFRRKAASYRARWPWLRTLPPPTGCDAQDLTPDSPTPQRARPDPRLAQDLTPNSNFQAAPRKT